MKWNSFIYPQENCTLFSQSLMDTTIQHNGGHSHEKVCTARILSYIQRHYGLVLENDKTVFVNTRATIHPITNSGTPWILYCQISLLCSKANQAVKYTPELHKSLARSFFLHLTPVCTTGLVRVPSERLMFLYIYVSVALCEGWMWVFRPALYLKTLVLSWQQCSHRWG